MGRYGIRSLVRSGLGLIAISSRSDVRFVSLGMVVLDELRLPSGEILHDCIGGSGAYSTLGARIVTAPSESAELASFILAGRDFPDEIALLFRGWGILLTMVTEKSRLSTRGLLEYHDQAFGRKTFRYTTTPLQPSPIHLPPKLLSSRSFHMLLPPEAVVAQVTELQQLRRKTGLKQVPLLVWEPLPGKCTKEHLEAHLAACRSVDVFSPNHLELLALFDKPVIPFDTEIIEICADTILEAAEIVPANEACSYDHAVVIRAGEHGCLVASAGMKTWLPPFFTDAGRVVDLTGGGNTFLGAFTVALQRTGDFVEAAIQGTVAASFAIEQIGLPKRNVRKVVELWNNVDVAERAIEYSKRLGRSNI